MGRDFENYQRTRQLQQWGLDVNGNELSKPMIFGGVDLKQVRAPRIEEEKRGSYEFFRKHGVGFDRKIRLIDSNNSDSVSGLNSLGWWLSYFKKKFTERSPNILQSIEQDKSNFVISPRYRIDSEKAERIRQQYLLACEKFLFDDLVSRLEETVPSSSQLYPYRYALAHVTVSNLRNHADNFNISEFINTLGKYGTDRAYTANLSLLLSYGRSLFGTGVALRQAPSRQEYASYRGGVQNNQTYQSYPRTGPIPETRNGFQPVPVSFQRFIGNRNGGGQQLSNRFETPGVSPGIGREQSGIHISESYTGPTINWIRENMNNPLFFTGLNALRGNAGLSGGLGVGSDIYAIWKAIVQLQRINPTRYCLTDPSNEQVFHMPCYKATGMPNDTMLDDMESVLLHRGRQNIAGIGGAG